MKDTNIYWTHGDINVSIPTILDPNDWCRLRDYVEIFRPGNVLTSKSKAMAALKVYGWHKHDCATVKESSSFACTCGWEALKESGFDMSVVNKDGQVES